MASEGGDLVSVIMAAYNAEPYIEQAVQSVLSQSHTNFELIVINDGSVDGTAEVLNRFDDERIHAITTENGGVSAARNIGLSRMRGDFFCFLDADDMLPVNSIKVRLDKLKEDSDLAFVDGALVHMNHSMTEELRHQQPNFKGMPFEELVCLTGTCFSGCTWLVVNDRSRTYRFQEGLTHGEDLLFYIGIADQGVYDTVDQPILRYRRGLNSAMSDADGSRRGYEMVHSALKKMLTKQNTDLLHTYKKKARSIMFKTYLKELNVRGVIQAIRMFR